MRPSFKRLDRWTSAAAKFGDPRGVASSLTGAHPALAELPPWRAAPVEPLGQDRHGHREQTQGGTGSAGFKHCKSVLATSVWTL